MIEGVEVIQLKKICDERGKIMHMLKCNDKHFNKFGEIYFSTVYPSVIKGWHIHKEMELNYAVVNGMIKFVLYDDRENSKTKGELMEICMGEDNYCLVKVPPMVWNGFMGLGTKEAIVANCASLPHSSDEIMRKDPFTKDIPYDWKLKHR
ncbi:dTDP-4-dehydrorhamnose 3,5-epimerase family protein [Candidatus Micrarchaeota archaeon]|nr:dTDP-4-dehydrorhamnose 3,5-epimerase family protein [Candidatus Micrarchaeota archaeon]MBU1165648.1 dTDP-4-dehydrorhamnose 3,5-epimerase family protein [Candidatus Micrarchaeota archaeon]